MNRREFLKAVGVSAAATQLPSWWLDKPLRVVAAPEWSSAVSPPLNLAAASRVLHEMYMPALRQQLQQLQNLSPMTLVWPEGQNE